MYEKIVVDRGGDGGNLLSQVSSRLYFFSQEHIMQDVNKVAVVP